jgi:hypothetical protein
LNDQSIIRELGAECERVGLDGTEASVKLGRDQVGNVLEALLDTLSLQRAVLLEKPPTQPGNGGRRDEGGHHEQSQ